jgi:hypothetical protein
MADQLLTAPVRTERPELSFRVRLDGVLYGFRLVYVRRYEATPGTWMLDISSSSGTPIVLGIRIVVGVDLLAPYRARDVPPGILRCIDTTNTGQDPTRNGLLGPQRLVYRPIADIPESELPPEGFTGGR